MEGLGFRVQDGGFRAYTSRWRVVGLGFKMEGLGLTLQDGGLRV